MFQIDFSNPTLHIHFIGIGGISMSGLAELLLFRGFKVSGSDSKESELTLHLSNLGANIFYGQSKDNISSEIDVVVMTAAIRETNPELMAARELLIPVITRAELLGQVMKQYSIPSAIAGTHGKTTTTSMISEILLNADLDPTLSIGGILPSIKSNFKIGKKDHFVTEACEYTNSFLDFFPKVEVILNIDADHLDFFKDLDDIRHSFHKFVLRLPDNGTLIINGDIDNLSEITEGFKGKTITFGLSDKCKYRAVDISYDKYARPSFTLLIDGKPSGKYSLGVTGEHNVINSLSAIAFSQLFDIPNDIVIESLQKFTGTDRRFQLKGEYNGITIIDDYAHHPTEISATLNAVKNYPHKTVWCIFQPHTYTRTKALLNDFAQALTNVDKVILPDIYAARETDTLGISSKDLADKINQLGGSAQYIDSFEKIIAFIEKNCTPGDLLITMGAGDVVNIGDSLLEK